MRKKIIWENLQRNKIIYELWLNGFTVDEISSETGVPRSTVGYYVRKFNKNPRGGKTIVKDRIQEQMDEKAKVFKTLIKKVASAKLLDLFLKGDSEKIQEFLSAWKLYVEVGDELAVTKEEDEVLNKNTAYISDFLVFTIVMRG